MSAPVTTPAAAAPAPVPARPWSAEVEAYAASQQVEGCLLPLWEATQRIFPAAKITLHVESDPEIRDLRWIIYEVVTPPFGKEESRAVWHGWLDELNKVCPAEKSCTFSLRLRRII